MTRKTEPGCRMKKEDVIVQEPMPYPQRQPVLPSLGLNAVATCYTVKAEPPTI